jgi:aryl-alcohol dehydrogenase-like predicted oxidoreductase
MKETITPDLWPLGETGMKITPVGLGVMQFAGNKGIFRTFFNAMEQENMNRIVRVALERGVNWFDTAEMYGQGVSEKTLATALAAAGAADEDVIISTKWNPLLRTARNIPHSIKDRMRHLDGYSIDLYLVHQPISFSSPEKEMDEMAALVRAGKIRSVGVSNFSAARMRRAHAALDKHGIPLAVNQVEYSLLNRAIEGNGILETARELGITIVAWAPLARGLLSGKFHQQPELLERVPFGRRAFLRRYVEKSRLLVETLIEIAAAHQVTPAQVALNWLISLHDKTVVVIPGASKVLHAEDAALAMQFSLSQDEIERLEILSREYRT